MITTSQPRSRSKHARALWLGALFCGLIVGGASALPPTHDDRANAALISALPYAHTETAVSQATTALTDPVPLCVNARSYTLWYRYVTGAAPEYLQISTAGSTYATVVTIFEDASGGSREIREGCNAGSVAYPGFVAGVRLAAGTSYSILIASSGSVTSGTALQLSVRAAPQYVVTKVEDTLDGSCDADCSLREAIAAHNADPGVVVVPPGVYVLTREGLNDDDANAVGDLDLTQPGVIYGAGSGLSIIDANMRQRVLQMHDVPDIVETQGLVGLTLRNGRAQVGAGLYVGAGSPQHKYSALSSFEVSDSVAEASGGGLYVAGRSAIQTCQIARNSAPSGGGIFVPVEALLGIESCTLTENSATVTAGGMDVRAYQTRLENSTFSRNHGRLGGGLYLDMQPANGFEGNIVLANVSLVGNDAFMGAGAHVHEGFLHLYNSLLAGNTITAPGMGVDCHNEGGPGRLVSGSYNLLESHQPARCEFIGLSQGNLFNIDARVSPVLAPNGGATPTHALLPGSPAIDSGETTCRLVTWGLSGPHFFPGPFHDQRGRARSTDGNGDGVGVCDRGAYEMTRAKGDFDGDRGTDLLLRNLTTGASSAWLMSSTTRLAEAPIAPIPKSSWRTQAVDDFTGDEVNDLVLRDQVTGAVEFWRLGGANGLERQGAPIPITNAPTLDSSWDLVASADFNRDGRADLLWRNSLTQKLSVWTMAGTERLGTLTPVPDQAVDANWRVVGALDLDGTGTSDLLWYNATTGKIVQWLMDDAVKRIQGRFTTPTSAGDNNWKVVAGGDYGRGPSGQPGTADLVWRNDTSGRLVVWHLDWSGTRTAGVFTTPNQPEPPLEWEVAGPR